MLELKNISKSYKVGEEYQHVLKKISINFRSKEFTSILGASGSGKTTLLNIIGGLDKYDSGDLKIDGVTTKKYTSSDWDSYRNNKIGFVFQNYNLIGHQTILSNVELSLTLSGVSKKERKERAVKALDKVGLKEHINKHPNQLSGGQMQRVAIARALVNDPDIILADEPTGALDSNTSIQIMDILKEISKEKLVIMVTHNPELAKKYSTRIIELKDGSIIKDSNPFEIDETEDVVGKVKKTSMSIGTSFELSMKNLMTKKGRTILTAIAGSIGIIGIALVLSLSNGVQKYSKNMEEDSSSDYAINTDKVSTGSLFDSLSSLSVTNKPKAEGNNLVSYDDVTSKLNSSGTVKLNNLNEFKKYLDSNEEIKNYAKNIEYKYGIELQIYSPKTYKKVKYIDVSPSPNQSDNQSDDLSTSENSNLFIEFPNDEAIQNKYELIAGNMPKSYNDVILIVEKDGSISDSTLYSLGIKDSTNLSKLIEKVNKGEKVDVPNDNISYDDILNLKYKVILNTDYYKLNGNTLIDLSSDSKYMKNVIDNALDLNIVGIVKAKSDSDVTTDVIGYRADLTRYIADKILDTDIAKEQMTQKNIDIFTGEELDGVNSTYDNNMTLLGIAPEDSPTSISMYPNNSEAKKHIVEIIKGYNQKQEEANREDLKITYTDSMEDLINGISGVIKVISMILIAVVSISLIVSSIMISIITYISVLERTKEIGILRAIGATKKDISRVFIAETLIEGLISGGLGVVVTLLLNLLINVIVSYTAHINNIACLSITNSIFLIALSMLLNLIAGLIPANMASKKDPVESLRTE